MPYNTLIQINDLETTENRLPDTSVIVVNPRHSNRLALLAYLLEQITDPVHYYALSDEDSSTETFLQNFVNDPQFGSGFGKQTSDALKSSNNPAVWAEAFANDVNQLHKGTYTIVFDQIDRIQYSESFQQLFSEFFRYLDKNIRVIINGRELFRHPWNELVQGGVATVVGQETSLRGGIFSDKTKVGQIEFYAIAGRTRVISDGFTVETWDGALPRNLCYFFIENERVTRQQIFQTFWPHLGIKEATNVFHVTKRKISEKLSYEITNYSGGFYIPSDKVKIYYDAREFERAFEGAMTSSEIVSASKWYRAVHIYRHPYLPEVDMPWANTKREKLKGFYVQALIELGRYNEQLGEPDAALGYYLRAVSEKPEREDVHRSIMNLYNSQGRKDDVARQYKILEKELKRLFNITPSKDTRNLLDLLMNN